MPPIFFRHYPMTSPKPDHSTDPNSTMPDAAPFMATEPAMVALKHPHSNAVAWVMTAVYFAALFAAVPILALLFLITMPLGVRIALWKATSRTGMKSTVSLRPRRNQRSWQTAR